MIRAPARSRVLLKMHCRSHQEFPRPVAEPVYSLRQRHLVLPSQIADGPGLVGTPGKPLGLTSTRIFKERTSPIVCPSSHSVFMDSYGIQCRCAVARSMNSV